MSHYNDTQDTSVPDAVCTAPSSGGHVREHGMSLEKTMKDKMDGENRTGDCHQLVTPTKGDRVSCIISGTSLGIFSGSRVSLRKVAMVCGGMNAEVNMCRSAKVSETTLGINPSNAVDVKFRCDDGSPVRPEQDHSYAVQSLDDFGRDLQGRGYSVTDKWTRNHVRWIVWKLASLERRFPKVLGKSCLTYDNVLSQLDSRYRQEQKDGQRSALHQILNRDESSRVPLALCVSGINVEATIPGVIKKKRPNEEAAGIELELTDGWYSVSARVDQTLAVAVKRQRIVVGTKLLLVNADLLDVGDGMNPLDDIDGHRPFLRLRANATKLTTWYQKLGIVRRSCHPGREDLLQIRRLGDVVPGGGDIPSIQLIVHRLYPKLYMQRPKPGKGNFLVIQEDEKNKQVRQHEEELTSPAELNYDADGSSHVSVQPSLGPFYDFDTTTSKFWSCPCLVLCCAVLHCFVA